jgi:RNA polymerase sigma factor (sigma-70 family)
LEYEKELKEYDGLLNHLARRYKIDGYDFDDLKQEFSLLLVKALDGYKNGTGAKFETFFTRYVKWWVANKLRTEMTEKYSKLEGVDDDIFFDLYASDIRQPDDLEKEERLIEFVKSELDNLKTGDFTYRILFEQQTLKEVSDFYGVSFQYVHAEHKRNLEKIKQLLLDNEFIK